MKTCKALWAWTRRLPWAAVLLALFAFVALSAAGCGPTDPVPPAWDGAATPG